MRLLEAPEEQESRPAGDIIYFRAFPDITEQRRTQTLSSVQTASRVWPLLHSHPDFHLYRSHGDEAQVAEGILADSLCSLPQLENVCQNAHFRTSQNVKVSLWAHDAL